MARYLYGGTAADVTTTQAGRLVTGATLTVWDSQSGGTQITDLQDATGAATTVVKSDAYGRILFYGPDADTRSFWLESNVGGRVLVRPAASIMPANDSVDTVHLKNGSVTSAKIADGTIVDADISASAAIARSKIAGLPTTSTDNTVPRFDGTTGALQNSGVTIDDSGFLRAPGGVRATPTTGDANLSAYSPDATAGVYLSSPAGTWRAVHFTTDVAGDHQYRFIVGVTNESESGGHAGSNFYISRWGDGWTNLGLPVKINRATGKVTLGDVGSTAGLEFGSSGPRIMSGTGSPESVVTAPVGSLWLRTDGGASTTLYVKQTGTGNTGWAAK